MLNKRADARQGLITRVLVAMATSMLACVASPALAGGPVGSQPDGGVTLHTTVDLSREVMANRLTIVMLARAENADPVKAQKTVEERVGRALSGLPKGVHAATSGYRAYQIEHSSGGKAGPGQSHAAAATWRVSETLDLRGDDRHRLWAAADRMAGHGLIIQALDYAVAQQTRNRVQNRLLSSAIRRWRTRIKVMAHALGCSASRVISLRTGSSRQGPRPIVMSAARSPGHAPPAREKIAVQVSGKARARGCQ